jgi:hypothetical protein
LRLERFLLEKFCQPEVKVSQLKLITRDGHRAIFHFFLPEMDVETVGSNRVEIVGKYLKGQRVHLHT